MKKVLLAALVLVLALAPAAARDWNIQLITMDQMDQHWANVDKGAQKAVEELGGINYRWNAPSIKDDSQQIECINNAIAQGADAAQLRAVEKPDALVCQFEFLLSFHRLLMFEIARSPPPIKGQALWPGGDDISIVKKQLSNSKLV